MTLRFHGLELLNFLQEELSELLAVEMLLFELDLDLVVSRHFLLNFLDLLEEGMIECLIDGNTEVRVKHKNPS